MENKKNPFKDISEFVEKIDNMKKQDKMDLSSDQDLSLAIMNLVSIEEHFFFTGIKTGNEKYFDLLQEVRSMRGELLRKIIKEYEGEVWCISKHLLAASMRLFEVGTKQHKLGNKDEAIDLFKKSFDLYSLFWGINMNIIKIDDIKKIDDDALNKHDMMDKKDSKNDSKNHGEIKNKGFMGKLGDTIKKVLNCCIE